MAKCRVTRADSGIMVNNVVSWSRDLETGYYWRSTQEVTSNTDEHTNKKTGKPIKDEKPCRVSDDSDYDYKMNYTGIDGSPATMYFKVVEDWQG